MPCIDRVSWADPQILADDLQHDGPCAAAIRDQVEELEIIPRLAFRAFFTASRIARGNATRARVRSRVEHVFAAQKCRLGLFVRTIGLARARAKIGLANLAYNFTRLVWLQGRTALA